jgi:hypothetical protein
MKFENKLLVFFIILGLLLFIFMLDKKLSPYKEEALLTRSPFNEIKILNEKVELNKKNKIYKHNIDCSKLETKGQILSYSLSKGKENYKVTASIKIFKNNIVLKDNYKEATNIETTIIVEDDNKLYEQIYIIETTCQQGAES